MRLRLICFEVIVFLFSCSKNPAKEPLIGSVSFSVNGTLYSWTEQDLPSAANYLKMNICTSPPGLYPGTYQLNITNERSGNLDIPKVLRLTILTSVLKTYTPFNFTNATAVDPLFPPHQVIVGGDASTIYNGYDAGDFATVIITCIHDQMADGNFTARLTRLSDFVKINITNGNFQNIKIMP